jgi:SAM-dependent methyltransferase
MNSILAGVYGFNIYKNWHCRFPIEKLSVESEPQKILISEPKIGQLAKRLNLEGMRILELGCLEGMHSLILQRLGAKEIIAIEGRKENFLKCLIAKNAFKLDMCKFLFGNVNSILSVLSGPFDLCLALGIFYHLENPVKVIHRIGQLAERIFVWTHYAIDDYPKGPMLEIKYQGGIYCGKYVREDTVNYLSGLQKKSFWMFEDDVLKAVKNAGFNNIDLIQKERHEHGPAMTFLAQK